MNRRAGVFLSSVFGLAAVTSIAMAETSETNNLVAGEYLFPPQRVTASHCFYELVMQEDGNLVNYAGSWARWASNTVGAGGYAALQGDGNFVIRNWNDVAVWSTGTSGNAGAHLVQQMDGNTVIYHGTVPIWATNTASTPMAAACAHYTSKTRVTTNTDRLGGDYKDVIPAQARASWCGYFCAQEGVAACKAWTYVPPGVKPDGLPHCYLKSSVPSLSSRSGFVSGRVMYY